MDTRRDLGTKGEDAAAEFLQRAGFVVIGRQVRTPFGEIDIVAKLQEEWVFVEVKWRRISHIGAYYPEQSITKTKFAHMVRAAEYYLLSSKKGDVPWRLDVVAISSFEDQPEEITHFIAIDGPCAF